MIEELLCFFGFHNIEMLTDERLLAPIERACMRGRCNLIQKLASMGAESSGTTSANVGKKRGRADDQS